MWRMVTQAWSHSPAVSREAPTICNGPEATNPTATTGGPDTTRTAAIAAVRLVG